MNIKNALESMKWKLVMVYCLLVFITMTVIGVILVNRFEQYYINSIKDNLTKTIETGTLISSLEAYKKLDDKKVEIQENIDAWSNTIQEEIFVVDEKYFIIASNNTKNNQSAFGVLDASVILKTLENGKINRSFGEIAGKESIIPVMNIAFPISHGNITKGVVYIRADMKQVYETIGESKVIFLKAMSIGLVVTIILGLFIANSIITPIEDVTKKARKMAEGDFSQYVEVKSADEIGRLAEMFNNLTTRLEKTLIQMSTEKNKLQTIITYMVDGLIAIDLKGSIIHANPPAMSILNISNKENIDGKNFDDLVENLSRDIKIENLTKKLSENVKSILIEKIEITYLVRFDWFKDEENRNIGIIIVVQDITQRQKLENMQKDFVANVSHELKTPLTTIKSYTETLLDGALDEKDIARDFLKTVDIEAERMNRLVKELLQLSRLDYHNGMMNFKEGNIVSVLKTAVKKVELTAANKGQVITHNLNNLDRIAIKMDRDGIEQVFLNILSNAIKYTNEEGTIQISVSEKKEEVQVKISDNGIGIPEKEKNRVFERFFRVDKARSRAAGGTGLGLSISKQIVENHMGIINIDSIENKGTTVLLSFPLSIRKGIRNIE